jgi:hypothetical protein
VPDLSTESKPPSAAVRVAVVVPFLAVLALSGWEGVSNRDSAVAHAGVIAIVASAVAAMVVAAVRRRRASPVTSPAVVVAIGNDGLDEHVRDPHGRSMVAGSVAWVLLFAALVGWDAFSFSQQSANTPTLSGLIGHITQSDVGRSVLFALWVAAGWLLATAKPRT